MVPRFPGFLLGLLTLVGLCPAAVFHGAAIAPNSNHAWVVTSDTVGAYHTPDLGKTWEYQLVDHYRILYDAFFLDSLNGWVCGRDGLIRHTTDGGDSWIRQNMSGPIYAYRIRFRDDSIGRATGDYAFTLYTTNAGNQWHMAMLHYPAFPEDSVFFEGLDFQGSDTIWMVAGKPPEFDTVFTLGQGYIARTTDGGDSWTRIIRSTVWDFYDVACIDARNVCVVGGNDRIGQGTVLRTSDAGATWYQATIPLPTGCLRSLKFMGQDYGWACGDSGTIIKTNDSGLTWNRQPTPTCSTLYDIDFADRRRGMASGAGVVLVTTDGGQNWLNATPIGIAEPKPSTNPTRISLRVLDNPSRPPIRFALGNATSKNPLAIYDAAGRIVATLSPVAADGRNLLEWNGLDLRGVPVPSGTYFARIGRSPAAVCAFTLLTRN